MPRGKKNAATPVKAPETAAPTKDAVRVEMMKRIYVARDPEATALTFLHHPECKDEGGKGAAERCNSLGCSAFSGLDVGAMIDRGYWNSLPGDR